jgi:hypothetical protein
MTTGHWIAEVWDRANPTGQYRWFSLGTAYGVLGAIRLTYEDSRYFATRVRWMPIDNNGEET